MVKKLTPMLLVAFMILAITPNIALAQEGDISLTLEQAIDIAYKSNPDLRQADLEIDKAQIQRDDAADLVTSIPIGGIITPTCQEIYNGYQKAEIALEGAKRNKTTEKERVASDVINAYTAALKNYNTMESARLTIEDLRQQLSTSYIAQETGVISSFDVKSFESAIKQAEDEYKGAQSQYESSISSLRTVVGKDQWWKPVLTSRAVLKEYPRETLDIELSRGISQSVNVWQSQELLDIEKSQEGWVIPNLSTDMRNINMGMAETTHEQAKLKTMGAIEQLYHGIDATEGQIAAAEAANEQAQRDLEVAQLKYDVGLTPKYSMPGASGSSSLAAATLAAQKAQYNLDSLQASLAGMKAQFAYLTGQTVYDAGDWTPEPQAVAANK